MFTLVADPFSAGVGLDRDHPLKHPPRHGRLGLVPAGERRVRARAEDAAVAGAHRRRLESGRVELAWRSSRRHASRARRWDHAARGQRRRHVGGQRGDSIADLARRAGDLGRRRQHGDRRPSTRVIATAKRMRMPVFTILPGKPDRGTLFDAGPDFYAVGRLGGVLAARRPRAAPTWRRFRSATCWTSCRAYLS